MLKGNKICEEKVLGLAPKIPLRCSIALSHRFLTGFNNIEMVNEVCNKDESS
jgi:hypothetical protein